MEIRTAEAESVGKGGAGMIKELLDRKAEVNLFTRPRRFGKTLNMSMLQYFFEDTGDNERNAQNRALFMNLKIMNAGDKYAEKMTQYPVISLSLKSAKQPDFTMAYQCLCEEIAREYKRHAWVIDRLALCEERTRFRNTMQQKIRQADWATSLRFLSDCLSKAGGKKCLILLDEYDVPMENAYFAGFYDEMAGFLRSLFESALKTNPNLEFAVITGCLRISRESIFTGLNNLNVVSVLSNQYDEYFGFSQKEVDQLLEQYCS